MQRLQFYIIRQMTVAAAMTVAGLTLAIWLSQSLRLLDVIVNRGLSIGLALKFLVLLLPGLIALLLPVAVFIAVLFVYQRLNADSEMVIMRSAGISNQALAQPAIIFGLAMSVIGYGLTLYAIPGSMRDYHDIQEQVANNLASVLIEAGVFTDLTPGVTFFAHNRDRAGGLSGIIVDDSRDRDKRLDLHRRAGRHPQRRQRPPGHSPARHLSGDQQQERPGLRALFRPDGGRARRLPRP